MAIEWATRAVRDLQEILVYISQSSEQNAWLVLDRIEKSVSLLGSTPAIGRPGRVVGTRELAVPQTPFVVTYREKAGDVTVLAVRRGARDWR